VLHHHVVLGLEADTHASQVSDADLIGIHVGPMRWCYSSFVFCVEGRRGAAVVGVGGAACLEVVLVASVAC
jgi:hypothetical protein